jgi:tetratricopeptide (TPR) repeat protein
LTVELLKWDRLDLVPRAAIEAEELKRSRVGWLARKLGMAQPEKQAETAAPSFVARLRGKLAGIGRVRTWAGANRLPALIIGLCLVLLVPVVMVIPLFTFWLLPKPTAEKAGPKITLTAVLEKLDQELHAQAAVLAERLIHEGELGHGEQGGPAYVLGVAANQRAEKLPIDLQTPERLLAAQYLAESEHLGFPAGREATGLFLLGKNLCLSGQIAAGRPILEKALAHDDQAASEIHRLLAQAYLYEANPRLELALEQNTLRLDDETLTPVERRETLLERGQIQIRSGDVVDCEKTIAELPPETAETGATQLLQARVLIHQAQALQNDPLERNKPETKQIVADKLQEAIKLLRTAIERDATRDRIAGPATYLIGVCYAALNDHKAALAQFDRTQKRHFNGPEGFAAEFQAAELLRRIGRDDEALAAYRKLMASMPPIEAFSNPWLTLDEFRTRMLTAYQEFLNQRKYAAAIDLAKSLERLFDAAKVALLVTDAHREWGRSLLAQAEKAPPPQAKTLLDEARAHFRTAGRSCRQLAQLRFATREYPDDLWNCAELFLDGHDYEHAAEILEKYLESELRRRRPRALVNLGEALLALEQLNDAEAVFRECIEVYPRDAASFEARVFAAQVSFQRGDVDRAEALLLENLNGDFLSPASSEWRDSLFALGRLLHDGGHFQAALTRLVEAAERYPDDPRVPETRYLTAESYRQLANQTQEQLRAESTFQARLTRSRELEKLLQAALEHYEKTQAQLVERQDREPLAPLEQSILRNCVFSRGLMLFELGRYEEALKAYSTATNRYQTAPEVLDAYIQLAACYRRLDQPIEARGTLEQAKVVLGRIKADASFTETTIFTRDEWMRLLDMLSAL